MVVIRRSRESESGHFFMPGKFSKTREACSTVVGCFCGCSCELLFLYYCNAVDIVGWWQFYIILVRPFIVELKCSVGLFLRKERHWLSGFYNNRRRLTSLNSNYYAIVMLFLPTDNIRIARIDLYSFLNIILQESFALCCCVGGAC